MLLEQQPVQVLSVDVLHAAPHRVHVEVRSVRAWKTSPLDSVSVKRSEKLGEDSGSSRRGVEMLIERSLYATELCVEKLTGTEAQCPRDSEIRKMSAVDNRCADDD